MISTADAPIVAGYGLARLAALAKMTPADRTAEIVRILGAPDELDELVLALRLREPETIAQLISARPGCPAVDRLERQLRLLARAAKVDPPPSAARPGGNRPLIVLGPELHETEDAAMAALAAAPDVFVGIDGRLVQLLEDGRVHPLCASSLLPVLTRVAEFGREKDGSVVSAPPPQQLALSLVARGSYPGLRVLVGVTSTPVLRPSGAVCAIPGYDAESRLVYAPVGPPPKLVQDPTLDQARAAVARLLEVVEEVPLQTDADRSAWLALLLTLVARHIIGGPVPLFVASSNQARTGKTRAIQMAGLISLGRLTPAVAYPSTDEELQKRVDAYTFSGAALVLWDNVRRPIGGEALEAVLTSTSYSGRVLGSSDVRTVDARTVWAVSANGTSYSGDAAPRTLPIRIRYDGQDPMSRTFRRPDLVGWVTENRSELQGDALTVVRAYLLAGRPAPASALPAWGSYEAWSAVVRGLLAWVGQPDPIETRDEIDTTDVTAEGHEQLVALTLAAFGPNADWTSSDLARLVDGSARIGGVGSGWSAEVAQHVIAELGCWDRVAQKVDRVRLGLRLLRYRDRPDPNGCAIVTTGRKDGVTRQKVWQVREP